MAGLVATCSVAFRRVTVFCFGPSRKGKGDGNRPFTTASLFLDTPLSRPGRGSLPLPLPLLLYLCCLLPETTPRGNLDYPEEEK